MKRKEKYSRVHLSNNPSLFPEMRPALTFRNDRKKEERQQNSNMINVSYRLTRQNMIDQKIRMGGTSSIQQLGVHVDSKVDIHSSYPRLSIGKGSMQELPDAEGTTGTSFRPNMTFTT